MLDHHLSQYASSPDGVNKALATYNQGPGYKNPKGVYNSIKTYGAQWADHIHPDAKTYFEKINIVLKNQLTDKIPGYFGAKR
jgi:hypothetical protein